MGDKQFATFESRRKTWAYAALLKAGVNAELHIFSTGSHGFGMGKGRGESTALWPTSFVAWLHDCGMIED